MKTDQCRPARCANPEEHLHDCLIVGLAAQRKARVVTFDAKAAKRLGAELLRHLSAAAR
jgi:hypothetical protein